MKTNTLFLLICMSSFLTSFGQLDEEFGDQGRVITQLGTSVSFAKAIKPIAVGKLLVAGYANYAEESDFLLIRYNNDGSIDNSFGENGIVLTDFSSSNEFAERIVLQPDEKILLGGNTNDFFALARFHPEGSIDSSFGTNGKVITDIEGIGYYQCGSLEIVADEKILLAGSLGYTGILIKYNSNGTLDNSFGENGFLELNFGNAGDEYIDVSMVVQPDGKIVVAGLSFTESYDFTLMRFTADGIPDVSFGVNGKSTADVYNLSDDRTTCMVLQSDGKILVTGWAGIFNGEWSGWDFGVARFNTNGTLDNTFGDGGTVHTNIDGTWDDRPQSIAIQTDDKIVVGGYRYYLEESDFALVRYKSDGSIDDSFGTDGYMLTDFNNSYDYALSLCIQSDGKILLAGNSNENIALTRYLSGSALSITATGECSAIILDIYPNPAQSDIILKYDLSSDALISTALYDGSGKRIMIFIDNEKRPAGVQIEILKMNPSLSAGNYFIDINLGKNKSVRQIIKL